MNVAICGYPPLALQMQNSLKNSPQCIDFKYFISDMISFRSEDGSDFVTNLPTITFFEFRRLINEGELDGVIIAEDGNNKFTREILSIFKLYEIPQVGVIDLTLINPFSPIYWLDINKAYIPYLNSNVVDGCNLNCKGCTHFAAFFKQNEIYPLENFRRDIRVLSQVCDVLSLRLLGGEPLLLKNLDEYIKITRQYFPKSNLGIVTNGLLIPSVSQKILYALYKENFVVYVSLYPPTVKILDKVKDILEKNKIYYSFTHFVENFGVFVTLHAGNDPKKSRKMCAGNDSCRFLRNGRIYKCPTDALKFRFAQRFGIENFPSSTSVDIYASNFSSRLKMLDDNVEMCYWCSEQQTRLIPWETVNNNPQIEDWLADPNEVKKILDRRAAL